MIHTIIIITKKLVRNMLARANKDEFEIPTDEERINALLRKITNLNTLEENNEKNHKNSISQKIQYN